MCLPVVLTCAITQADTICWQLMSQAPFSQPGPTPSDPENVYVVPLYVFWMLWFAGSAHLTMYAIVLRPSLVVMRPFSADKPFNAESPFSADRPFNAPRPFSADRPLIAESPLSDVTAAPCDTSSSASI